MFLRLRNVTEASQTSSVSELHVQEIVDRELVRRHEEIVGELGGWLECDVCNNRSNDKEMA